MANAQTAIFKFESVNPIRSIIIDGQPWFVAQDVCSALRIQNVTQALEKLDDDERSMFNIGHEHRAIFDSRVKEINIISESGLYTLILRCRDAVTPGTIPYRFRKWVTGEVLPQIRRTGSYIKNSLPQEERIKMVADQLQDDGHDVSGAAAELTTMFCYIVGVSKCLRDIQTHAEYINDKAGFF